METREQPWIEGFADELLGHWPQLGQADAEHIAEALWQEAQWRCLAPEQAALRWVREVSSTAPESRADRQPAANDMSMSY
jgi:hypothetical protein